MFVHRAFIAAVSFCIAANAAYAQNTADNYPNDTIKIIVCVPPGGAVDSATRIIAERLRQKFGKTIVIDNRGGQAGNIGAEAVATAKPDGYTLLAAQPAPLTINGLLYKKLNYDPAAFEPVAIMTTVPNVLLVRGDFPAKTIADFITHVKAHPGKINYASQGNGTTSHLTAELFQRLTGTRLVHVPYRGTAPAMNDLVGGHILFMFDNLASSLPQHQAGKLKILAICTPQRSPHLPDVPTMSEAALPGFTSIAWFGLVAPPGTPDAIVEKINKDVVAVLKSDEMRKKFQAHAAEPIGNSRQEAEAFMQKERAQWGGVIEKAKLKAD